MPGAGTVPSKIVVQCDPIFPILSGQKNVVPVDYCSNFKAGHNLQDFIVNIPSHFYDMGGVYERKSQSVIFPNSDFLDGFADDPRQSRRVFQQRGPRLWQSIHNLGPPEPLMLMAAAVTVVE